MQVSDGFARFGAEFPRTAEAHMGFVQTKAEESALDAKTLHLAYLAVLSATGMTGGLPFHVQLALDSGATEDEVKSAAMVGMQAVGLQVLDGLAAVCAALEEPGQG